MGLVRSEARLAMRMEERHELEMLRVQQVEVLPRDVVRVHLERSVRDVLGMRLLLNLLAVTGEQV